MINSANRTPLLTAGSGRLRKLISIYFLFYLGFSAFSGIFVLAAKDRFNWGPQPTSLVLVYVGVVAVIVQEHSYRNCSSDCDRIASR